LALSLKSTAAAAAKALQRWYGADSYASNTGLYTWDASDATVASDLGISSALVGLMDAAGYYRAVRDTARWWNSANAITALIDYMLVTKDHTYLDVVDNTFTKGPNAWRLNVGVTEGSTVAGAAAGAAGGAAAGAAVCGFFCAAVGAGVGALVGATATAATAAASFGRIYNTNFIDDFYDDDGWWALAWIKAYDLTGDMKYLNMAVTIFNEMSKGWDYTCRGGLYWQRNHQDTSGNSPYKNAITNELFLAVASALYLRFTKITSDPQVLNPFVNWAEWEWGWFSACGLINSQNLVNDSLNTSCQNDQSQPVWTYNQGVILSGLCDLAEITGNPGYLQRAEQVADALIKNTVDPNGSPPQSGVADGILTEYTDLQPNEGVNNCQFKGIFIRNLAYLYTKTHNAKYSTFITRNAASAVKYMNSSDQFGHRWDAPVDQADFVRQTSGLDLLNAAMLVQASAPDVSYLGPLLLSDDNEPLLLGDRKDVAFSEHLLLKDGRPDGADVSYIDPLLLDE
jgi:predicted alpha-1,6-mannanase (GH76 family)